MYILESEPEFVEVGTEAVMEKEGYQEIEEGTKDGGNGGLGWVVVGTIVLLLAILVYFKYKFKM